MFHPWFKELAWLLPAHFEVKPQGHPHLSQRLLHQFLVVTTGFEPITCRISVCCSEPNELNHYVLSVLTSTPPRPEDPRLDSNQRFLMSLKRESNPRPSHYKCEALPLSYSGIVESYWIRTNVTGLCQGP